MRTRSLVVIAGVGLVLCAIGTALVLASNHLENKAAFLSLALTVGLSFLASGVIALWRRPDNRTGLLLVLVSYLWFLGALTESNNDWVWTIGFLVNSFTFGAFIHLLLAYPTGRLQGRRDRWLVVTTYVLVFVASAVQLLVDEQPDAGCPGCESTIAVANSDTAHTIATGIISVFAVGLVAHGARDRRHALRPREGRSPPRARPGPRHRSAGDGDPDRPADRGLVLGGCVRLPLLRLPRRVRGRAGRLPGRRAPQPAGAESASPTCSSSSAAAPRSATRSRTRSAIRRSTSSTGCRPGRSSSFPTAPSSRTTAARVCATTSSGTDSSSARSSTIPPWRTSRSSSTRSRRPRRSGSRTNGSRPRCVPSTSSSRRSSTRRRRS